MYREMMHKQKAKTKNFQRTVSPQKNRSLRNTVGEFQRDFRIHYATGNNSTKPCANRRNKASQVCHKVNRNNTTLNKIRLLPPGFRATEDNASLELLMQVIKILMNSYGGGQGQTFHSKQTTVASNQASDRLNSMYLNIPGHPGAVIPRPYAKEEDIHRFLRWFSTYISCQYKVNGEVQCYLDKTSHCIIVATNLQREARKFDSLAFECSADGLDDRQKRHIIHMKKLLEASKRLLGREAHPNILMLDNLRIDGASVYNMHAEQRILSYYNQLETDQQQLIKDGVLKRDSHKHLKLLPDYLGGLRRPCLLCSYAVFDSKDRNCIHPGPAWVTKSSGEHMHRADIVELINDLLDGKVRTYVSGMLNEGQIGKVRYDRDTDSDSEPESALTAAEQYDAIEQNEDWSTPDLDPKTNRSVYDRMAKMLCDLGIFALA